jgi:hypothetical protein
MITAAGVGTMSVSKSPTREEFEEALMAEAEALLSLVQEKNCDYAGSDPLKNFRKRGVAGGIVRVEDKLARWDTFLEGGGRSTEDWEETFRDIAGYAVMMLVWLRLGADDPLVLGGTETSQPR